VKTVISPRKRDRSRLTATVALATCVVGGCTAEPAAPRASLAPSDANAQPPLTVARALARGVPALAARLAPRATGPRRHAPPNLASAPLVSSLGDTADTAWHLADSVADSPYSLSLRTRGLAPTPITRDDGHAVARDVAPSTDAIYLSGPSYAELLYVLRDAAAPTTFELETTLGEGLARGRADADGGVELLDRAGRVRMYVEPPFAIDANGVRRAATLRFDPGLLRITLDRRGLAFPILLDPYVGTARWVRQILEPQRREGAALATLGSTLYLFGGRDRTAYADTWKWDGATFRQLAPAHAPPARSGPAMATLGGRVVLFGGLDADGVPLSDTWTFDGGDWTQAAPAHHPAPRDRAGLASLPLGSGQVVLFGGLDASGSATNDTWDFDGVDWTLRAPSSAPPAPPAGDDVVMTTHAGEAWLVSSAGTWSWDGTRWLSRAAPSASGPSRGALALGEHGGTLTAVEFGVDPTFVIRAFDWTATGWLERPAPTVPPGRVRTSATTLVDALVVFGGSNPSGAVSLSDFWSWDGTAFKPIVSRAIPSPRARGAMTTTADGALLFGGVGEVALDDTWRWDGTRWLSITSGALGTRPPARFGAALVGLAGGAVLFGGTTIGSVALGDTWTSTSSGWRSEPAGGPGPLAAPEAVRVGDNAVFRVVRVGSATAETWSWSGAAWTKLPATAATPTGVGVLTSFGAEAIFADQGDGEHFSFDGTRWSPASTPRAAALAGADVLEGHGVEIDHFALAVITRALSAGEVENAAYAWNGADWAQLALSGLPPRTDFSLARHGRSAVLFGGLDEDGALSNETFVLALSLAAGTTCTLDEECETGHCAQQVCCSSACTGATQSCALPASRGACVEQLSVCADATTVLGADSVTRACAPYLCASGRCLTACGTSADCAGGNVCDTGAGTCQPATPTQPAPTTGCTLEAGAPGSEMRWRAPVALSLLALLGAGRRRRRARGPRGTSGEAR
jgi:hypothetical protein